MYSFTYQAHTWASVSVYVSWRCRSQLTFGERISQVSHWTSLFQRDYLGIEPLETTYPCHLVQWLQVLSLYPSFYMSTVDPNKSMSSYTARTVHTGPSPQSTFRTLSYPCRFFPSSCFCASICLYL